MTSRDIITRLKKKDGYLSIFVAIIITTNTRISLGGSLFPIPKRICPKEQYGVFTGKQAGNGRRKSEK
jgi:hypothetical protein